jgi:hypothetical protein
MSSPGRANAAAVTARIASASPGASLRTSTVARCQDRRDRATYFPRDTGIPDQTPLARRVSHGTHGRIFLFMLIPQLISCGIHMIMVAASYSWRRAVRE